MADISLSKATRANLNSLTTTASMMAETQNRLSTGNQVNSALDNPSNWFTAKGLNNRAGDLNSLLDGMANGIQTLKAADNGLSAMTKTLESMQSTLRQARQDKSFQTSSLGIDATAIGTSAAKSISFSGGALDAAVSTSVSNSVKTGDHGFGGSNGTLGNAGTLTLAATSLNSGTAITVNLVAADTADTALTKINTALSTYGSGSGVSASVVNGQIKLESSKGETITADGTAAQAAGLKAGSSASATAATLTAAGGTDYSAADPDFSALSGKSITLTSTGGKTATYTFTASATGQYAALQSAASAAGFSATKTNAGVTFARADGENFTAAGTDAGTGNALGLGGASKTSTSGVVALGTVTAANSFAAKTVDQLVTDVNGNTSLTGKIRASNDNGKLRIENQSTQKLDITGASGGNITGANSAKSDVAGNTVRTGLAAQFNELRDQLDKLADDASFNGINLLRGDKLAITFNETGTSSIDIQTKKGDTINSANLGVSTTIAAKDLDSDTNIDNELTKLKTALNSVRSQASSFGSNLSIVQGRQDFTNSMIGTLKDGAGHLTLADMNSEAANLLALQTRQSLASNSLSLASRQDQAVLQLIR